MIAKALAAHRKEIKKVMLRAEALGLKEADDLKRTFIAADMLRAKIVPDGEDAS